MKIIDTNKKIKNEAPEEGVDLELADEDSSAKPAKAIKSKKKTEASSKSVKTVQKKSPKATLKGILSKLNQPVDGGSGKVASDDDSSDIKKTVPKESSSLMSRINNKLAMMGRIPVTEKIFFANNLRVMVKSGLSMSDALKTLAMQTKSKKFQKILTEIKAGVLKGNTLSQMLENYPKVFPEFFTNMIRVGELSGNLEKNLEQLSIQMKKDHNLMSKVRGAMIYPMVIMIATVGIVILMFVYVIPSVLDVFNEMEVQLPFTTRMLIIISDAVTDHGVLVVIVVGLIITGITMGIRTDKGKKIAHFLILKAWIIGPIAQKVNLARFSRTISSLLKTDIPVIDSFKITSTVLGNVYYKEVCKRVSVELAKGVPIHSILDESPKLFPPLVTQMASVGEKSGTLDELLGEVAIFYETEVEDITKNLSSIIEPILIVFLGAVVGFIAFAVISPIYSLSSNI